MPRKLIAGNWKMNGSLAEARALAGALTEKLAGAGEAAAELLVCPPAVHLCPVAEIIKGTALALGGQDCHAQAAGAHTGDVSAAMLADLGCRYVIVGHSERRADHGEESAAVKAKAKAAAAAGLVPIICVGESLAEREAGQALAVVERQVSASLPDGSESAEIVVAYEPVWAIGTGKTATPDDVAEVHTEIRRLIIAQRGAEPGDATRILYGGSVKAANAAELLAVANVDGALVGGASLKAEEFWAIATSVR